MSVFTAEELDSQIAAYKSALLALATAKSYQIEVGNSRRTLTREDLSEIRNTLDWLSAEKQKIDTTTSAAASRTYAKNGGGRW